MTLQRIAAWVAVLAIACTASVAHALPTRGQPAPSFSAVDIHGNPVSLDVIIEEARQLMVVLFFFSVDGGDTLARRLRTLDALYGKGADPQRVEIIGVGYREDEAALRAFAEDLNIRYFIVESGEDGELVSGYGPIQTIPLTFLIDDDRLVLSVLRGGGEGEARILSRIAEQYLTKEPETATGIAATAVEEGEDAADAGVVQGYALAFSGNLDAAAAQFEAVNHATGLAHVAVERGDLDNALALATTAAAEDPFAHAVAGRALLLSGQAADAAQAFAEAAAPDEAPEWQRSHAINGHGRALHATGDLEAAVTRYAEAGALDKYNIAAASNQGAAYRELGEPEKALAVLEAAQARAGHDALIAMMLQQVAEELAQRNDNERQERIRQRIATLGERWRAMQESGEAATRDTWSSRPSVVAFLPTPTAGAAVFERAGTGLTLRREVERRLAAHDGITVVDRDLLDELLRELELSDALGDPNTQLQLGRVLAARALATVDFNSHGREGAMLVRLVDTETTSLLGTHTLPITPGAELNALADTVVQSVAADLAQRDGPLQGLVAGMQGEEVVLNLGAAHGVVNGMRFYLLHEQPAMVVGGRTVPGRRMVIGQLEVTDVYDDFASAATVVSLEDDAEILPETKVMAAED